MTAFNIKSWSWFRLVLAILAGLGLVGLSLGLSLLIWPQVTRRQLLDWYLATPGKKSSQLIIQAVQYHWPTHGTWDIDSSLTIEGLSPASEPLGTTQLHLQGPVQLDTRGADPQLAAELDGELSVQVQGVTLRPTGLVKIKNQTWYVRLAEPVWPVKGFYTLSETGAQGEWSATTLEIVRDLGSEIMAKTNWSDSELMVENGRPLVILQGQISAENLTRRVQPLGWSGVQFQTAQVTVKLDPATWQPISLDLPLEGVILEPFRSLSSLGVERLNLHWSLTISQSTQPVEVIIPADAQPLVDFWQRLEPPPESSAASRVLGVEAEAGPAPRPTELPLLSTWQIELLKQYGFQVESR